MTNTATAFLLLLCLLISTASAAESPPPVIDIDGKPVRSNTNYFILPVFRGRGGGLTLIAAAGNTSSCPLAVAQADLEVDRGLPVTFTPVDPGNRVVRESSDLNFKFSASSICVVSTVWRLAGPDESTGNYFVSIGGLKGNPGRTTTGNWFKIVKNGRDYNLRFCPTVCNFCKVICRDVGISVDADGKRRLVLSDEPFRVFFKKAQV